MVGGHWKLDAVDGKYPHFLDEEGIVRRNWASSRSIEYSYGNNWSTREWSVPMIG